MWPFNRRQTPQELPAHKSKPQRKYSSTNLSFKHELNNLKSDTRSLTGLPSRVLGTYLPMTVKYSLVLATLLSSVTSLK